MKQQPQNKHDQDSPSAHNTNSEVAHMACSRSFSPSDIARALKALPAKEPGFSAAVLIPLIATADGYDIVFELRSHKLDHQPGEVSLPGGRLEAHESFLQAAIRETCEELLVDAKQIKILGELGEFGGGSAHSVRTFVGILSNYEDSFNTQEVECVFRLPLSWFMENPPLLWTVPLKHEFPSDFPFELIPGGKDYPWGKREHDIAFYIGTDPIVWGLTARIIMSFVKMLRNS